MCPLPRPQRQCWPRSACSPHGCRRDGSHGTIWPGCCGNVTGVLALPAGYTPSSGCFDTDGFVLDCRRLRGARDDERRLPRPIESLAGNRLTCGRRRVRCDARGCYRGRVGRAHGRKVVLVEPGRWVGGMMSGGLSNTDTGQRGSEVIGGLAGEFFRRARAIEETRGACLEPCASSFFFEPQVAEQVFETMLREAGSPSNAPRISSRSRRTTRRSRVSARLAVTCVVTSSSMPATRAI